MSSAAPLARLLGVMPPPPPPPPVDLEALTSEAFAQGRAAALLEAEERIAALEAAHRLALAAAEARVAALIDAAAAELAATARALARAILRAEPAVPEAALEALAKDIVEAGGSAGLLRLNPADHARLHLEAPQGWRLVADPAVPSGEVRGECDPGLFMASIARRADALLGAEAAR